MPVSHRIERVARLVQHEVARILHEEVRDPRIAGAVFTIHEVRVSRDLSTADIYFSVLDSSSLNQIVRALETAKGFVRSRLSSLLDLRRTPELCFHVDRTIEEGMRLERIIEEANRPGE